LKPPDDGGGDRDDPDELSSAVMIPLRGLLQGIEKVSERDRRRRRHRASFANLKAQAGELRARPGRQVCRSGLETRARWRDDWPGRTICRRNAATSTNNAWTVIRYIRSPSATEFSCCLAERMPAAGRQNQITAISLRLCSRSRGADIYSANTGCNLSDVELPRSLNALQDQCGGRRGMSRAKK
jgi:hypothetical protein